MQLFLSDYAFLEFYDTTALLSDENCGIASNICPNTIKLLADFKVVVWQALNKLLVLQQKNCIEGTMFASV